MVLVAAVLERWQPVTPWIVAAMGSEPAHVAAHTVLYGVLALALVRHDASRRRQWLAAAIFMTVASVQEGAQIQARHRLPNQEEAFDLTVDVTGATLALVLKAAALP